MTAVQRPTASADAVVDRLADLVRSLATYEAQSNGVEDEIRQLLARYLGMEETSLRETTNLDLALKLEAELRDDPLADAMYWVVAVFLRRRLEAALALHGVPYPRYPVGETTTADKAPPVRVWQGPAASPELSRGSWTVLGYDVGFPVGIPSCELTGNADWIEYYARMGFHVLTYRTVRSKPRGGSPYDWVFLAGIPEPWTVPPQPLEVQQDDVKVPRDWRAISTATSYEAPSPDREIWVKDVEDARRRLDRLGGRHILIVSVTDSVPLPEKSDENLSADFVNVALLAEGAGAHAIECYLARATMVDNEGHPAPCERSVRTSIAIVEAVRAALDPKTRLLIKLSGTLPAGILEEIVANLARRNLIDGVSGISPVEVDWVRTEKGQHAFESDHRPGVAGYALRRLSQSFVERLAQLRERENLSFDILAMGGIMTAEDVAEYLRLGATAVQAATAAICDLGLAEDSHRLWSDRTPVRRKVWDGVVVDEVMDDKFWATIVPVDRSARAVEAQFELGEVHHDQRREVLPGAVFRWTTNELEVGSQRFRQSTIRFRRLPGPMEDEVRAGDEFADEVISGFEPLPVDVDDGGSADLDPEVPANGDGD